MAVFLELFAGALGNPQCTRVWGYSLSFFVRRGERWRGFGGTVCFATLHAADLTLAQSGLKAGGFSSSVFAGIFRPKYPIF
jgi:hypothetical protein